MKIGKKSKVALGVFIALIFLGLAIPEDLIIPVKGATEKSWNHNTFWYEPWGQSGVHKGIDIFSPKGMPVVSSTSGIVLYKGELGMGGKVIAILGPKWRVHYYAHLNSHTVTIGSLVKSSEIIGRVGDSGNAKGKAAHLHYAILSLLPHFWRWDLSNQGWKKIFYLNPSKLLLDF